MKISWLTYTRPDCVLEISQMAQVTKDMFEKEKKTVMRRCNELVKHVHKNNIMIIFPKLDKDSLRVVGFLGASFAGNIDFASQFGCICFLARDRDFSLPKIFKYCKARRVTRSVMAVELIRFSGMSNVSVTLGHDLKPMLRNREVHIRLYTDSKSLFDVISKGARSSESCLMLGIAADSEV